VSQAALAAIVERFRGKRILVVADLVADEFVHGHVDRVSREAPVMILRYEGAEVRLGGGGNAIHNLRTLGATPLPLGMLGRDVHGQHLRSLLKQAGISVSRITLDPTYLTPVKTRVLAGGTHSTKQQIVRIDRVIPLAEKSTARAAVVRALERFRGQVDGVLVSDYGLGLVTPRLVRTVVAFARGRGVPVTVDSRYALTGFKGMTAVTPNEPEVEAALGIRIGHDRRRLEQAGRRLLERLGAKAVLITRGSDGMALFEPGRPPLHIPVYGTDQVADVTGAGDTVIASFTLALAAGARPAEASRLANYAGGIVVMKRGTATVSGVELSQAIASSPAGR
jgi:rfaE bifunctional protein kinase chain/domain